LDFREATENVEVLSSKEKLEQLIKDIARQINATLLTIHSHDFGE
jgi:S-adenosylmethionine/arginine decarboxylase-like enzyme